jgi:hypothetical protein
MGGGCHVQRHGMLKVKVVVAIRMAAVGHRDVGSSAGGEQKARWISNGGRVRVSRIHLAQTASIPSIYDLIRVTGRPAFRRASINEVNPAPALLRPEYVSSCNSGKSPR